MSSGKLQMETAGTHTQPRIQILEKQLLVWEK